MSRQLRDDQILETKKPLLELHPQELKFTFEVKKQSSCAVQLTNLSDQYVAFKVKTTSPKKYCVRPNTGIVKPKSACEFTVTMQAQRSAPLDMHCKDKFLIQSTVAPFGTSEEDIEPGLFAKDSGKYIEECKLKVVLASPSHSLVLSPVNGVTKEEQPYVISAQNEKLQSGVENLPPPQLLVAAKEEQFSALVEESSNSSSKSWDEVESKIQESIHSPSRSSSWKLSPHKDVEGSNMRLSKDIKELNSNSLVLESKLIEAELTIKRLKEENITIIQEKEVLKQELGRIKRKGAGLRQVQRGFPPLSVCMVAFISLAVGFFLRSG